MKFDSAAEILTDTQQMLLANQTVAGNRALILKLFNGDSPYTDAERREQNLKTNVNWLDGTRIASNASSQLNNAFLKGRRFFTVKVDKGPVRLRPHYGTIITNEINKALKRCRQYSEARKSANAQVVLHGPAPLVWKNRRTPVPRSAGVDDVLVPQGTLTSMENLDRFGVYRELTFGELEDLVSGPAADPGWNMPYITALLGTLYKSPLSPIYQGNRWLFPEKMAEDVKEGAARSTSSALAKALCWDFFFRNEDTGKWNRRMIFDYSSIVSDDGPFKERDEVIKNKGFLYTKDDYAEEHSEIVHFYIGNCSNQSPFRYYSIRSIGYLLYGACMINNRLRNRSIDHVFEALLNLFRNVSDDHREKLQLIDLQNYGVLPDGVSMVTANERHQVDWNLVMGVLNQNRQTMAESASSFVPDMQNMGTGREMTATETLVRQNASVTLTSAVLGDLGEQSTYEYREICRRFCLKGNPDPMAKSVREACRKQGVPDEVFDIECWEIIPEQTVGGGNKAVEITVTQALMQEMYPIADPEGQRIILRRRYEALTDNPEEAMVVVPEAPKPSGDIFFAQFAYGTLMDGAPVVTPEGINHVAYAAMLMQLMGITLQQTQAIIEQPSGLSMASEKLAGLFNVTGHVQQEIMVIARSEQQKDKAKQLAQALAQLEAQIQELAKMAMKLEQEQAQAQGGIDPQTQAKIQERLMLAQAQAEINKNSAEMKQSQKQISWAEENARRNATTEAEMQRKLAMTRVDIMAKDLITASEIRRPKPASANE